LDRILLGLRERLLRLGRLDVELRDDVALGELRLEGLETEGAGRL
jgi:hypothetical protein